MSSSNVLEQPELGPRAQLDFSVLLDDLMEAAREQETASDGAAPSLRVDLMAQIERLQDSAGGGSDEAAMREYLAQLAEGMNPDVEAGVEPMLQPALDDLFFLDPATIARELGIEKCRRPAELDQARRNFALRFHPDRVPEDMRERAKIRMQIANMLIDEAKRVRR